MHAVTCYRPAYCETAYQRRSVQGASDVSVAQTGGVLALWHDERGHIMGLLWL